ncbi:phage tail protein [Escherichia coli]
MSRTAVPGAAAMAINRVASSAISQSASQVARETKVRRKLVKERARLKRPRSKIRRPESGLTGGICPYSSRVMRGSSCPDAGVVKGTAFSLKGGGSVLVVGNRRIPGAFIQQLKNGRWHVMQRVAGKTVTPLMW